MNLRVSSIILILLLEPRATAGGLPPIGKRQYILEDGAGRGPVQIRSASVNSNGLSLKDPVQPKAPVPIVLPKPKSELKKVELVRKSKVRFRKLSVSGYTKNPKIEFSSHVFPINRVDEPVNSDFFEKVFLPAQDNAY